MDEPKRTDGDELLLIEEDTPEGGSLAAAWRILIVDDETDVHSATEFALAGLKILGRPLEFLHAYSAAECRRLLAEQEDIAVALLDVVMEQEDAGLQLVRTIRKELKLTQMRIILRTGQPGYAPEIETIHEYDINDYKTKSELTRPRLYAAIATALRAYEQIHTLDEYAFYDHLCRLPNRNRFIGYIDECLAAGPSHDCILALLDIDDFAETNDALGHQQGDRLLQAVAERLTAALGNETRVARVGGDVFGILGKSPAMQPELLLGLFRLPFPVMSDDMMVSATLGLVSLDKFAGGGHEALKDANIALKRAKVHRRGRFEYFTSDMGIEIRERVRLLQGLRAAFENEQQKLFVVYQPQILLADARPYGAEALIRWRTEDGRFVPPDRFISLAEYSGLIVPIGEWVLRTACLELQRLHALGAQDYQISVNVSLAQFRHPEFLAMLGRTVRESGIDPQHLELEITESMAVEDPDFMIETLQRIRDTGVAVAIDDFGTGYSSLSQLRKLPVDRLKIDRAFVTELNQSVQGDYIASLVIELGQKFDLRVIAEGIETEQQAATLKGLGCHEGQGYLYARPMAAQDLHGWLAARNICRSGD